MPLQKSAAQTILSQRPLSSRSQQIADYWLSLWDHEDLPDRADINPAAIKPLLPGIIFFHVIPDISVHVGLAGTAFRIAFDRELTGADWLALTPPETRLLRLTIFSLVARGSIGFNQWRFPGFEHKILSCEKLLLPLRYQSGPAIPVLGFVDWNGAHARRHPEFAISDIAPPSLFDATSILEGGSAR